MKPQDNDKFNLYDLFSLVACIIGFSGIFLLFALY
jgi:hypothetical protein